MERPSRHLKTWWASDYGKCSRYILRSIDVSVRTEVMDFGTIASNFTEQGEKVGRALGMADNQGAGGEAREGG